MRLVPHGWLMPNRCIALQVCLSCREDLGGGSEEEDEEMRTWLILAVILVVAAPLHAIQVTQENDFAKLIDSFLSTGSASNVSLSGDPRAIGTYTNSSGLWGLDPGIVLSSGHVSHYSNGPNTAGDFSTDFGKPGHAALTGLAGHQTYDAVSFKFDFTAAKNTISYDFLFGTEEYAEWVGSQYNDAFGAWLTDPSGAKTQLSFDKQNHPVTVNTAWMSGTAGTELDGTTGLLRTTANVAKGKDYSIEFVLGDTSDHIFDSTTYLSNFEGAAPNVYGLFIGVQDIQGESATLKGDVMAQNLHDVVLNNVPGFKDTPGNVLTANVDEGGMLTKAQVKQAIDDLADRMKPGDTLLFYSGSHGGTAPSGTETTANSPGDELLGYGGSFSGGDYLTDDDFKEYFTELEQIDKWVMIDACHSGGFWGDFNPNDDGDLEKLDNISLFAACGENGSTPYSDGFPVFGSTLLDAFGLENDRLRADGNGDGDLTFNELVHWVADPNRVGHLEGTVVHEMDFGDPYTFMLDMWSPVSMASPDFSGSLLGGSSGGLPPVDPHTDPVAAVPLPGAFLLTGVGASLLGLLRRRRIV